MLFKCFLRLTDKSNDLGNLRVIKDSNEVFIVNKVNKVGKSSGVRAHLLKFANCHIWPQL